MRNKAKVPTGGREKNYEKENGNSIICSGCDSVLHSWWVRRVAGDRRQGGARRADKINTCIFIGFIIREAINLNLLYDVYLAVW